MPSCSRIASCLAIFSVAVLLLACGQVLRWPFSRSAVRSTTDTSLKPTALVHTHRRLGESGESHGHTSHDVHGHDEGEDFVAESVATTTNKYSTYSTSVADEHHVSHEERHSPHGAHEFHVHGEGEDSVTEGGEHHGSHGEHSGAHEHGEHEHHATPVDLAISGMLCGSIAFVMMIFYAVNYDDADIQYYAWSVLSSTVSIFTAVLIFHAINGVFEHFLLAGLSHVYHTIANYVLFLIWLGVLQLSILLMAGVFGVPECMKTDTRMIMIAWGTLLSHMVGFASIFAGGTLQHFELIASSPTKVLLAVLVHALVILSIFRILESSRTLWQRSESDRVMRLWLAETKDAENDIAAISLSFLLVQGLRYAISGVLPNHEGLEEPQLIHSLSCTWMLFGVALASVVIVVALLMVIVKKLITSSPHFLRLLHILQATFAMVFAWSIFYVVKWQLKRFFPDVHPNSMIARVVLALVVSGGSFGFIFSLDKLEDLDSTGDEVDKAIVSIINALGILVGFAWEQSFEGAAGCLASLAPDPVWTKLGQAVLVAVIVIPAWRKYILRASKQQEVQYQRDIGKRRTRRLSTHLEKELGFAVLPSQDREDSRQLVCREGQDDFTQAY